MNCYPDRLTLLQQSSISVAPVCGATRTGSKGTEEVAVAYVAELLKSFRMIHKNPKGFEPAVLKYIPDTPKKVVGPTVRAYLKDVQAWPQNGGDLGLIANWIVQTLEDRFTRWVG